MFREGAYQLKQFLSVQEEVESLHVIATVRTGVGLLRAT